MRNNLNNILFLLNDKQKRYFSYFIFLSLVSSFLEVLSLGTIIPVLGSVLDPDIFKDFFFYNWLVNFAGNINNTLFTIYSILLLIIIFLLKNLFLSFFSWFNLYFINSIRISLSRQLYNLYLNLPFIFHLKNNSTILFRNIDYEVLNVSQMVFKIITLIVEILVFLSIVLFLFIYDPMVTFVSFMFVLVIGSAFYLVMKSNLNNWGKKRQFFSGEFLKHLFHGLNSIKDVKMLDRQNSFLSLFYNNQKEAIKYSRFEAVTTVLTKYLVEFISILGLGFFVALMTILEKDKTEIIITITLLSAAIYRLAPSVNKIITSLNSIQFLSISVTSVSNEFRKIKSEKFDQRKDLKKLRFSNDLKFENINFKYPGTSDYILKDTNFYIKKNSIIGFHGKSGSGKTTLINIICNLLTPESGDLIVDGKKFKLDKDMCKLDIGYISQSTALIDDTIEKNIAFGIPEDQINKSTLENCIKISRVSNFLKNLPKGLKTKIGEKGTRLSGGQQQRVGIARALYNNPELLIIDEGTNSLDSITEKEILNDIKFLKNILTIIIVSHDMNIIKDYSDYFFELKEKKLIKN